MIKLPRLYLGANPRNGMTRNTDESFHMDDFARAAMETWRSSYAPMPTASVNEFAAFFSKRNYDWLFSEVTKKAGNEPDEGELYEAMMWAFSSVAPRSDEMDERREDFSKAAVGSYVREMNKHVIEKVTVDTVAANQLWEAYAKYRNGPAGWDGNIAGEDTRTRFVGSQYDMTYLLP